MWNQLILFSGILTLLLWQALLLIQWKISTLSLYSMFKFLILFTSFPPLPSHFLQITFFCKASFRIVPLYKSSSDTCEHVTDKVGSHCCCVKHTLSLSIPFSFFCILYSHIHLLHVISISSSSWDTTSKSICEDTWDFCSPERHIQDMIPEEILIWNKCTSKIPRKCTTKEDNSQIWLISVILIITVCDINYRQKVTNLKKHQQNSILPSTDGPCPCQPHGPWHGSGFRRTYQRYP